MRTVICMPTYNERENLPSLVEEIFATAEVDLLVVDDGSPDGTGQLADEIAAQNERLHVMHRPQKSSLAAAYVAGFDRALEMGYDAVFQMDADYSHQPCFLPPMLDTLTHSDVVIGSRYVVGATVEAWSFRRRLASKAGNAYVSMVLNMPYRDATAGYVGWKRHVLEAVDYRSLAQEGRAFQIGLKYRAHRLGFTLVEVPISFWDRVSGTSKLTPQNVADSLFSVVKVRLRGDA